MTSTTVPTFVFGQKIDMTAFDFSQYASGSIVGFSSSEVELSDSAGDTLDIKGSNFSPFGPSGTITSFTVTDAGGDKILTGSNLNIDIGQLFTDRNNAAALEADLFGSGVSITGSKFGDVLVGGAGDDTLAGGAGNDRLDGGGGNNTASYATAGAAVTVAIKAGSQKTGGAGFDTLVHIQNLTGSRFGDTLTGNVAANKLAGGAGDDTITGGGGGDTITGGAGADTLTGGAGNVKFVYKATGDSTAAAADTITDFHAGDKIDISAIDANTGAAGHQSFHLGATAGHVGDVVVSPYDTVHNRTEVSLFVNGDAIADAVIWLKGNHHALTTSNFIGVTAAPAVSHFVTAVAGHAPTPSGAATFSGESPRALTPVLAAHR